MLTTWKHGDKMFNYPVRCWPKSQVGPPLAKIVASDTCPPRRRPARCLERSAWI